LIVARRSPMQRFARWHIWLGWLAALPLLLWTLSGVFMTLRPIEEVRGGALRAEPAPVDTTRLLLPSLQVPVNKLTLVNEGGRAVWIAAAGNQEMQRFSGSDGQPIGPVQVLEARQLAEAAYAGKSALITLRRFSADHAPLDLRTARPSWQARFADGTHVYIDADTGEVLALRTSYWRAYDFMWGLHIMDPMGRENTSHVLLWLFGTAALVLSVLGTVLLFRRRTAK
jgi:PepSY-associated TM region